MDPDLQIRGGGGWGGVGHPDPEITGGTLSPKTIFSALRASFWSKNKGGRAPRAPPLDPLLELPRPGELCKRFATFCKEIYEQCWLPHAV